VEYHLQEVEPEASPSTQCRIRVYANVDGLSKAYRDANIITADDGLVNFIRGFNMENVLCDFVDAGSGKECSDVKLKGN
jgi:hypothetical protein